MEVTQRSQAPWAAQLHHCLIQIGRAKSERRALQFFGGATSCVVQGLGSWSSRGSSSCPRVVLLSDPKCAHAASAFIRQCELPGAVSNMFAHWVFSCAWKKPICVSCLHCHVALSEMVWLLNPLWQVTSCRIVWASSHCSGSKKQMAAWPPAISLLILTIWKGQLCACKAADKWPWIAPACLCSQLPSRIPMAWQSISLRPGRFGLFFDSNLGRLPVERQGGLSDWTCSAKEDPIHNYSNIGRILVGWLFGSSN